MTSLANKTIQSIGNDYGEYADRCTITCEDGVQDAAASWGATYNAPLEPPGLIPELYNFLTAPENLVIFGIVFLVFLLVSFFYFNRVAK
jgi:hypothetical protein